MTTVLTTNLPPSAAIPPTPLVDLAGGARIPQIGLGVLRVSNADTQQVVESALGAGYRHIDAAAGYGNEQEVGAGIKAAGFSDGPTREQLWLTTKLKDSEQGYDSALRAFDRQIGLLDVEYVDMYMIHWPTPFDWRAPETWKAFRRLRASGRARTLGVCNFLPEHLERLYDACGEYPVIDQIELHPTWQQRKVVEFCRAHSIAVEAYSPIARGADLTAGGGVLTTIAARHGVSVAQVILRWHIENGTIIIPKSVHLSRQIENASLFDFALSPQEHEQVSALDSSKRAGHDPMTFTYA